MKNSILISFVFLLLFNASDCPAQRRASIHSSFCSPTWEPLFPKEFGKGLFKMTFDISRIHLTGLMMIKETSPNSIRMVFTNEIGMQFFDLEFSGGQFIVHSIFPSMNRRSLLKLLERDFRMMLYTNDEIKKCAFARSKIPVQEKYEVIKKGGTFIYIIDNKDRKITGITTRKSVLAKAQLSVTYGSEKLPNQISIYNPTQKLHINLLLLSN
jgi:hypothetical protein